MKKFNIKEAVEKKKIIPFADGPKIALKELKTAKDDMAAAKESLTRGSFKWATTQAYYAFFHASRALLYLKKYREKGHIHLAFAIKFLYVDEGLLPQDYYDDFLQALDLREMADYKRKFSKQGAERNIEAAEKAINLVENILMKKQG